MIPRVLSSSVIAFLATVAGATAAQAAPSPDAAACAAALDVVTTRVADHKDPTPWAVVGTSGSRDDGLTASSVRKGMKKDPPSPALAAKFVGRNARDPIESCPDVRGFLERNGIVHDQPAIDQILAKAGKGAASSFPLQIFSLSLPVLGADGRDALTDTGFVANVMGGSGEVIHLRKGAHGHWRRTDAFTSWVN